MTNVLLPFEWHCLSILCSRRLSSVEWQIYALKFPFLLPYFLLPVTTEEERFTTRHNAVLDVIWTISSWNYHFHCFFLLPSCPELFSHKKKIIIIIRKNYNSRGRAGQCRTDFRMFPGCVFLTPNNHVFYSLYSVSSVDLLIFPIGLSLRVDREQLSATYASQIT